MGLRLSGFASYAHKLPAPILDLFATKAHLSLGQESVIINSSREGDFTIFHAFFSHFKYQGWGQIWKKKQQLVR